MDPRRATVEVTYNGKDATIPLAPDLDSVKYTDVASGSSDDISFEINDKHRRWINGWFPQKGDRLTATIRMHNWEHDGKTAAISCGSFCVDDFSFKGGPIRLSLKGLAIPADSGFKTTKRTYTYEKTTLKEIGRKVASRAGITLYYEASEISIEKVAQDNEDDCSFYNSLVTRFGLALKVFNNRLVVFNEGTYEARSPVATLGESDFDPGWTWNTTLDGTYTGVKYQYTNSDKDKVFTVTAGSGNRILTCNEAAENLTEATVIALAALNNANKKTTTMKITIRACRKIIATSCVEIVGLGKLSGKYFVEEVSHSIGSGYKMSLSLRKVEARFTKASSYSSSVAEAANGTTSTDASETVSQTQNQNFEKCGTYELTVTKKGYYTAAEAVAGAASGGHPTSVCKPGSYYIFNTAKGMLNITKKQGSPGSWINPN